MDRASRSWPVWGALPLCGSLIACLLPEVDVRESTANATGAAGAGEEGAAAGKSPMGGPTGADSPRPDAGAGAQPIMGGREISDDAGPGARVDVTISVSEGGSVQSGAFECGAGDTCEFSLPLGGTPLLAHAEVGYVFDRWSGDCRTDPTPGPAIEPGRLQAANDSGIRCGVSFLPATGDVVALGAPSSVVPGATSSAASMRLFLEREEFPLPEDAAVDMHGVGAFSSDDNGPAWIPNDTRVDTYLLHVDVGATATEIPLSSTITFPGEVLGAALAAESLEAGDRWGAPGVVYPESDTAATRGLEVQENDTVTLDPDRRSLTVFVRAGLSTDQLRVFVLAHGQAAPLVRSQSTLLGSPPADLATGQTETDGAVLLYEEPSLELPEVLFADVVVPGEYAGPASWVGGDLAAGLRVRSYLIHADQVGTPLAVLRGSLTFPSPIVGLFLSSESLVSSDALFALEGLTHAPASGRGEESSDRVVWSPDGRTLRWSLEVTTAVDQVRVLVAE